MASENIDGPDPEIPNPRHKKRFIEFEQKSLWSMVKTFFLYNHYFVWYWLYCVLGEVEFTRVYYDIGYKVTHFPDTENLIYSYKIGRFKTSNNEFLESCVITDKGLIPKVIDGRIKFLIFR